MRAAGLRPAIGLLDTADAHHERAVDDVDNADQAGHALLALELGARLLTYDEDLREVSDSG
jgi:hypothetical protein